MMFWHSAIMLGIDAVSVINARIGKLALEQLTADETSLMVSEKIEVTSKPIQSWRAVAVRTL